MPRSLLVSVVIGAACALASLTSSTTPAAAATVEVTDGVLIMRAGPGESGRYLSMATYVPTQLVWVESINPFLSSPPAPSLVPGQGCGARHTTAALPPPRPSGTEVECVPVQAARLDLTAGGGEGNSVGPPNVPTTVLGSPGVDTISGAQPLTAYGFGGNDNLVGGPGSLIDGGAGDDNLTAFSGATVIGGPGNDQMTSSKEHREIRYDCGPGQDTLNVDRRAGRVQIDAASCPPILIWPESIPLVRLAADRTARVRVRFSEPARGSIRLSRGRDIGAASVRARVARATVRIRVSKAAARRIRKRGRRGLIVTVLASLVDGSGERSQRGGEDSFAVRLRAAR